MRYLLAVALFPSLAFASESLSFYQDWFPGPRFAGIYVAADHGFYRDAGLDIAVHAFAFGQDMPSQIEGSPSAAVGTTEAAAFLGMRASGHDLVVLNAVFRDDPAGLITLEKAPRSARELAGKSIGVHRGEEDLFRSILRGAGLGDSSMKLVPMDDNIARLGRGEAELMEGSAVDEFIKLQAERGAVAGFVPLSSITGVRSYSQVLFTTREQLLEHGAAFSAFIGATRAGWAYAALHPDEAVQSIGARMGRGADLGLTRRMLLATLSYVLPHGDPPLGPMEQGRWAAFGHACVKLGSAPAFEDPRRYLAELPVTSGP